MFPWILQELFQREIQVIFLFQPKIYGLPKGMSLMSPVLEELD